MTKDVIEIQKIVVNSSDELIDIIRKIEDSEAEKIVLTFTEPSDILISPINLKVLQETADEGGKALISQIVQNPVGVRNASQVGMLTTESPGAITETQWSDAENLLQERLRRREGMLKSTNNKTKQVETPEEGVVINEEVAAMPAEPSEYQKRIASALEKAKTSGAEKKESVIDDSGVEIALGKDLDEKQMEDVSPQGEPSLIGRDLKAKQPQEENEPNRVVQAAAGAGAFSLFLGKVGAFFAGIPVKMSKFVGKTGTKMLLLKFGLPLLGILILSLWLAYRMSPLVKIQVFIESKPVEVERTFTGNTNVDSFDFDNLKVPVKKEEVTKSRSDSTEATGTAYRGEKAEGIATFKYFGYSAEDENTITVPAGTTITDTNSGLSFITNTQFQMGGPIESAILTKDVAVTAAEVGEEYNLASGKSFTVSGFDSQDLVAENNEGFSGGSKEGYTVVAQSDVNGVVKNLKKDAFTEAEEELNDLAINGWQVIDSTVKSEVEGDPELDVPVGSEAEVVNVTIKTKSTALYFQRGDIDDSIEALIKQATEDESLFESTTNAELRLDENVDSEVKVSNVSGGNVTIDLIASTSVRPDVNKEEIVNNLKGKSWDDGNAYIESLDFTAKDSVVTFGPDWFPKFLRYFPSRQGRILISIIELDTSQE